MAQVGLNTQDEDLAQSFYVCLEFNLVPSADNFMNATGGNLMSQQESF